MREGLKSSNEAIVWCSRLMYFCFKHERDTFVHEFYGKLYQDNFVGSFEEALNSYDEYVNALRCRDMVTRILPKEEIREACLSLSISFEHLKKYSNFALNKLKRKLFKAYLKYVMTRKARLDVVFENQMRRSNIVLNEYRKLYKDLIIKEEKYIDRVL